MDSKQEVGEPPHDPCAYGDAGLGQLIDIIETVYRGASKGRGLVVSPKGVSMLRCSLFTCAFKWADADGPCVFLDYSTRYRY